MTDIAEDIRDSGGQNKGKCSQAPNLNVFRAITHIDVSKSHFVRLSAIALKTRISGTC